MTKKKKNPTATGSKCISSRTTKSQTFKTFLTPQGLKVNSGLEARVAEALDTSGIAYQYEPHRLSYIVERFYVPDFILPNGIIVECKGWFLSEDRRKMVHVKKQHPHLDIRFVFEKANSKGQQSKVTNEVWATKNGFQYAIGLVPKAWIKE